MSKKYGLKDSIKVKLPPGHGFRHRSSQPCTFIPVTNPVVELVIKKYPSVWNIIDTFKNGSLDDENVPQGGRNKWKVFQGLKYCTPSTQDIKGLVIMLETSIFHRQYRYNTIEFVTTPSTTDSLTDLRTSSVKSDGTSIDLRTSSVKSDGASTDLHTFSVKLDDTSSDSDDTSSDSDDTSHATPMISMSS